jgi:hypothetical protein
VLDVFRESYNRNLNVSLPHNHPPLFFLSSEAYDINTSTLTTIPSLLYTKRLFSIFLCVSVRQVHMETPMTIQPIDPQRDVVQSSVCCVFKYSLQCLVLQIPHFAEFPGPAFQPNIPTNQQAEVIVQNCSCVQCSDKRRTEAGPQTWYPVEQQLPSNSGHFSVCCLMMTGTATTIDHFSS